jgi:hypothetical protein
LRLPRCWASPWARELGALALTLGGVALALRRAEG